MCEQEKILLTPGCFVRLFLQCRRICCLLINRLRLINLSRKLICILMGEAGIRHQHQVPPTACLGLPWKILVDLWRRLSPASSIGLLELIGQNQISNQIKTSRKCCFQIFLLPNQKGMPVDTRYFIIVNNQPPIIEQHITIYKALLHKLSLQIHVKSFKLGRTYVITQVIIYK